MFPLRDDSRRTYQWRQTIFRADGTTADVPWTTADATVLVVGQEPRTSADVRIEWIGTAGDAFGLRVDFWSGDAPADAPTASVFLRAGTDNEKIITLPLAADGTLSYRYELRREAPGGETLLRAASGSSTLLVVQA